MNSKIITKPSARRAVDYVMKTKESSDTNKEEGSEIPFKNNRNRSLLDIRDGPNLLLPQKSERERY
jgi:hypothetical protein